MEVPKQLKHLSFCRVLKGTKKPFEKDWTNKPYNYEEISKFFPKENYGVLCGYHKLAVIDCDKKELKLIVEKSLPKTFSVKTGGGGIHFYYFIKDLKQKIILKDKEHLGEVQSYGTQIIGAGSIHPNKKEYEILDNVGIETIDLKLLKEVLGKFFVGGTTEFKEKGEVDDYKNLIFEISKKWNEGDRQKLALSVSGYLRKEKRLGINKAREIITEVCRICKDEELEMRLRAVVETYKKDEKDIKGIKGFLEFGIKEQKEQPGQDSLEILKDPNLFKQITEKEFDKRITGEYKSRKAIFLSLCSIWVKNTEIPLNTLVSSESSAGKSYICKNVLKIFPKRLYEMRSKISAEAFTYWKVNDDSWTWDGKICYLEDIGQNVLDSPTFKVMCSEGSIATIVRNQKAIDLFVNGKPCMLVTTAGTNPSTEVINRFSITPLDESAKQTKEITFNQAMEIKDEDYNEKIREALNHLKREKVSVPFALQIHNYITKNYNWNDVRMRRDFSRLRDLIKCSAVLHQFQREEEKGKIIANKEDYEIARECINYIQTTTLKGLTHKLKKAYDKCIKEKEFTAKDIHSKYPFVSMAMWYRYLDDLCERGLLITELKDSITILSDGTERAGKKVTHYLVPKTTSFDLPSYDVLQEYSIIDIKGIIDIKDTKDTKEGVNYINSINSTTFSTPKLKNKLGVDKK